MIIIIITTFQIDIINIIITINNNNNNNNTGSFRINGTHVLNSFFYFTGQTLKNKNNNNNDKQITKSSKTITVKIEQTGERVNDFRDIVFLVGDVPGDNITFPDTGGDPGTGIWESDPVSESFTGDEGRTMGFEFGEVSVLLSDGGCCCCWLCCCCSCCCCC